MTDLFSLTIYKDQKPKTSTGIYAKRKMGVTKKREKDVHLQTRSILLCRAGQQATATGNTERG